MTKLRTLVALLVCLLGAGLLAAPETMANTSHPTLTLTAPGLDFQSPHTLLVAARLNNASDHTAFRIRVRSGELGLAPVTGPLPIFVGRLAAGQSAVVQLSLGSKGLIHKQTYQLVLTGTFQAPRGQRHKFVAKSAVVLPPAAPGEEPAQTAKVAAHSVHGAPFPPQPPSFDTDVNGSRWTVPTGRLTPAKPTAQSTSAQNAPFGDPPPILFEVNNGLGISGNTTAEPSGGVNGGGVVFVSANSYAAFSTDNGSTFTQLNPTTIFPSGTIGFCCDQIVQYVPSIDRVIWLLQGTNGFRLASATPAAVASSGGTAWTYWNLPSNIFNQPTGTGVDYPDLSVGTQSLYLSWDVGWPSCPTGCNGGFQVSRISLTGIQAGGTVTIFYTNPPDSSMAWGGHLTQDTGNEIFWAGHNSNSQMRVFSWAEGSSTYFWRDVNISTWANNALSSLTPDGMNWLAYGGGFPGSAVIGSTRVGCQVWFAWMAGTDKNFKQAHIEMVTLDRCHDFRVIQQVQIWNPDYAFGYPALATNACTGEVGLSFEFGGGGNYENHVVGFWGDFVAYITTGSNVGTTRFGDYVTIRQAPPTDSDPGNLFAAFGYGLNSVPPPGSGTTDVHYVLFGRPASSCIG